MLFFSANNIFCRFAKKMPRHFPGGAKPDVYEKSYLTMSLLISFL